MTQKSGRDYSSTLQLPRTNFSMRANLLQSEPRHQERWKRISLFERSLASGRSNRTYVFHDGPPYANGPIHMGHLLNKILKDLVVRSRSMDGYKVHFVPGWDCHGLPIEHRVLKELGNSARQLGTVEIRRRCRDYASKYVVLQSEQLKRLGTLADYAHPYVTMDARYEGAVLDVFSKLVAEGLVYRDVKPVHWSIANQTALAEAELEYYERTDTSVFVLFEVDNLAQLPPSLNLPAGAAAELMIWTTTPWTLPANLAVAVLPSAEYGLYRYDFRGAVRFALVAEQLYSHVFSAVEGTRPSPIGSCRGDQLIASGIRYHHPFVTREGIVVGADYVTLDDGTGLVHTAPGHGAEDYFTGIKEGLPIYCPVLGDGTFDETVPEWLQGKDVWTANQLIVDHLVKTGRLFHSQDYEHSYPHDWRSKTPTIFRATEQWFIGVDTPFGREGRSLRERALNAARNEIKFIPEWGQSRLEGMLLARPDWCISRQRAWGLPIPAFLGRHGETLLTAASTKAVADVVREKGSDFWFEAAPTILLANYDPQTDPHAPDWLKSGGPEAISSLEKSADIFDVWFESGSSWNAVLRDRELGYPSALYLEGSDQHRGWFQLSLLPALGTTGQSPFRTLLTHGFTLDVEGRKMSKSLGNAIEVEEVLRQHGADICRWWVSSLNYTNDIKVDWEFFKVASEEYRKIRNTIRFMLGNLADFDRDKNTYVFREEDRHSLDSWALGELSRFVDTIRAGYDGFEFRKVSEAVFNFCNNELSAVYLAAMKDRLYCDRADSPRRRRCQTAMYRISDCLIRAIAPILVHTAEEAWLMLNGLGENSDASIHLELLPSPFEWEVEEAWTDALALRERVLKALEEARAGDQGVKNPLEMGVVAQVSTELWERLEPLGPELGDLCGVSRFSLVAADQSSLVLQDLRNEPRCERSWKRDGTVKLRSDGGYLSDRDAAVLEV